MLVLYQTTRCIGYGAGKGKKEGGFGSILEREASDPGLFPPNVKGEGQGEGKHQVVAELRGSNHDILEILRGTWRDSN